MRRTEGPFLAYEIVPRAVYQRGKLHGLSRPVKVAGLAHLSVTRAVALAPATPDPDLSEIVSYTHHPIPDAALRPGAAEWLLETAAQLAGEVVAGGRVLTMCNAGRNRSGLLSALVVRELSGLPGAAALRLVQRERPNALANPYFRAFLEELP